jgi:hypothetical protein
MKTRKITISLALEQDEYTTINTYSRMIGVCKATAIKMFLRKNLPSAIRRMESKKGSVA